MATNRKSTKVNIAGFIGLGFAVAAIGLAPVASADFSPKGPNHFAPTMPEVFPSFYQPPFKASTGAKMPDLFPEFSQPPFSATAGTGSTTLTAQGSVG